MAQHQKPGPILPITQLPILGAIKIGHLYIPHKSAEQTLARYSKQIFIQTGYQTAPYSLRGSSTAVKYKGRLFAIACHHQYRDLDINSISISMSFDPPVFISPGRIHVANPENQDRNEDFEDLDFLEFPHDAYGKEDIRSHFLDLTDAVNWHPGLDSHFMAVGFPSELQILNLNEEGATKDLETIAASTGAQYAGRSNSPHLHRIALSRKSCFDTDGMSGSPLFFITGSPGTYEAGLAGIITRGGKNSEYMHFVDWAFIKQGLERITSAQTP